MKKRILLFFLTLVSTPLFSVSVPQDGIAVIVERNGMLSATAISPTQERKNGIIKWQLFCTNELAQKTMLKLEPLLKRALPFIPSKKITIRVYDNPPEELKEAQGGFIGSLFVDQTESLTAGPIIYLTPLYLLCSTHLTFEGSSNTCSIACLETIDLEYCVAQELASIIAHKNESFAGLSLLLASSAGIATGAFVAAYKVYPEFLNNLPSLCKPLFFSIAAGMASGTTLALLKHSEDRTAKALLPHRKDVSRLKIHFIIGYLLGSVSYSFLYPVVWILSLFYPRIIE